MSQGDSRDGWLWVYWCIYQYYGAVHITSTFFNRKSFLFYPRMRLSLIGFNVKLKENSLTGISILQKYILAIFFT